MNKNKWWGYIHSNGSLQIKRYFDQRDIEVAKESSFVLHTIGPCEAITRDDAEKKLKEILKEKE